MGSGATLRDHARGAVRDEVMKQAWLLFSEQGFEATTVDQIALAAGMSRRTFFRYFTGKDELVLERLVESRESIAAALSSRPPDERIWVALRRAFDDIVSIQEQNADRSRPLQLMLREEPGMRGSVEERRRRWQETLEPLVAQRLPRRRRESGPDVRAGAITASALACLEAAQDAWVDHPRTRLATLVDRAMNAVGGLDG